MKPTNPGKSGANPQGKGRSFGMSTAGAKSGRAMPFKAGGKTGKTGKTGKKK